MQLHGKTLLVLKSFPDGLQSWELKEIGTENSMHTIGRTAKGIDKVAISTYI